MWMRTASRTPCHRSANSSYFSSAPDEGRSLGSATRVQCNRWRPGVQRGNRAEQIAPCPVIHGELLCPKTNTRDRLGSRYGDCMRQLRRSANTTDGDSRLQPIAPAPGLGPDTRANRGHGWTNHESTEKDVNIRTVANKFPARTHVNIFIYSR